MVSGQYQHIFRPEQANQARQGTIELLERPGVTLNIVPVPM